MAAKKRQSVANWHSVNKINWCFTKCTMDKTKSQLAGKYMKCIPQKLPLLPKNHFVLYLKHLLLYYSTASIPCQKDILDILIVLFLPCLLRLISSSYLLPPSSSQLDFLAILIHEHVVKRGEVCPYKAACIHIYPE